MKLKTQRKLMKTKADFFDINKIDKPLCYTDI